MGAIKLIDMCIPVKKFEDELNDFSSDWLNNNSVSMECRIVSSLTKMGKKLYRVVVENPDSEEFEIVAEETQNSEILFKPIKLMNMNKSFYKKSPYSYHESDFALDPEIFLFRFLADMARRAKQSFGYYLNANEKALFVNGELKDFEVGLIDSDGCVYSETTTKSVSIQDDDSQSFQVKKPIFEWLKENPDISLEVEKIGSIEEKMNYIGKKLIVLRASDEITASEFSDIFIQAGIIGFSDPSVLNIYKLFI